MPSDFYCNENTNATYQATIEDENGVAIPSANITSITLTLYDRETGDIINNRDGIGSAPSGVTIHATSGLLTWLMEFADNVIVTADSVVEHHKALFEFVASGKRSKHEVNIYVSNLAKVP
jgi:hypothetical protein